MPRDIGGGSHHNNIKDSLSYIPLRWMIKESFINTNILFDHEHLKTLGFDLLELAHELAEAGVDVEARGFNMQTLKTIAEEAKKQSYEEDIALTPQTHAVTPLSCHGIGYGCLAPHFECIDSCKGTC